MKKAERLLKIIDLMRSDPTYTAGRLAQECCVSERTLYRDIAALTVELGVPIHYEDGYKLTPNAQVPYTGMTPGELLAIYVAATSPALSPRFPHGCHLDSAMAKIGGALGAQASLCADRLAQNVSIDAPAHPDIEADAEVLAVLESCVRRNDVVRFMYASLSSGKTSEQTVEPYAMTFRRHSWYLVGYSEQHGEFRTFKVRRIRRIEQAGKKFNRDRSFTLEQYFANSWELYHGQPVKVVVRFAPCVAQIVVESRYHPSQSVRMEPDGSALLSVEVAGVEEISRWLLGFGGDVEVLEPEQLRDRLLREGVRIAANHGGANRVMDVLEMDPQRILVSESSAEERLHSADR